MLQSEGCIYACATQLEIIPCTMRWCEWMCSVKRSAATMLSFLKSVNYITMWYL